MIGIRRRLRLWVAVWLTFQALSLSAFVPRDCCAAHRVAASNESTEPSCHNSRPASEAAPECMLGSNCNGPLGIVAALLSPHAVLGARVAVGRDVTTVTPTRVALETPFSFFTPPDSPPPRS